MIITVILTERLKWGKCGRKINAQHTISVLLSADTRDMKDLSFLEARLVACFQAHSLTVLFLSSTDALSKSFTLDTHSLLQNCNLLLVKHTQKLVLAGLISYETGKRM
jgi:hypothetical protein